MLPQPYCLLPTALPAALLAFQECRQGVQLLVGEIAKGGHDGARNVGGGVLEVAHQPLHGTAPRSLNRQVGSDFGSFPIKLVTGEAAFLTVEDSSIRDQLLGRFLGEGGGAELLAPALSRSGR